MEFVTPEEIASNVVLEIKGSNTGVDVIAAIDSEAEPGRGLRRAVAIRPAQPRSAQHDHFDRDPDSSARGRSSCSRPRINVPEYAGQTRLPVTESAIDDWAERGWLDLRPANIHRWQERFRRMLRSAQTIHRQGSAAITMEAYRSEEIRIGEVVGWIFNNEEEGYRIK